MAFQQKPDSGIELKTAKERNYFLNADLFLSDGNSVTLTEKKKKKKPRMNIINSRGF